MHIEKEYQKLENIEEIRVYNFHKVDLFEPAPIVPDYDQNMPLKNIMKHVVSDINIFEPIEGEEDFIIDRLGWNILERGNVSLSDVEGRKLSQASPFYYDLIGNHLLEVLNNHETKSIRIYYYINDEIHNISNIHVVYENGKIYLISDYQMNSSNQTRISKKEREIEEQQKKANLIEYFSQTGSYYKTRNEFSWSPGIYNIINRSREENDNFYNIIFDLVIPEDKALVEELLSTMSPETDTYENILRIKTHDGHLKYLDTYLYSKFDENGEEISHYGLFKDVSADSHRHMTRPVDFMLNGFKHNSKIALLIEPLSKRYEFSEGFYKIFEISKKEYSHNPSILNHIVEDEARNEFEKILNGEVDEINITFTINIPGDDEKQKICELFIENFKYGNKNHSIGFLTDITEEITRKKELEESNEHKNILIKEVHHRVKNNLQLLNSFLNLEKREYADDPELIIEHMQTRLNSLALLHERTYQTQLFANINLEDYIKNQDEQMNILLGENEIKFESKIDPNLNIPLDIITPLLLIIDELTMNALKHAFTDENDKQIYKELRETNDNECELIIKDNGKGLGNNNTIESHNLGWEIIRSLTNQMNGKIEILNLEKGSGFKITFPIITDKRPIV